MTWLMGSLDARDVIVALLIGVMGGNVFQRSLKKPKVLKTLKNKI